MLVCILNFSINFVGRIISNQWIMLLLSFVAAIGKKQNSGGVRVAEYYLVEHRKVMK